MATIKSFTDLPQSKVLAEILPLESADMYYSKTKILNSDKTDYIVKVGTPIVITDVPCWSLAALLDVLPEIQGSKPVIALDDNYITYPHMSGLHFKADNLVDACYEMIIKLHDQKLL